MITKDRESYLIMKNNWNKHVSNVHNILSIIDEKAIDDMIEGIWYAFESQKNYFIAGNGGSALNASHFAQDLSKGVIENGLSKPRIRAISLCNDIGFITATSNDSTYDDIFVNQLVVHGNIGDTLLVISGSGNSPNIVKAVDYAKDNGINTFGILGYDGGTVKSKLHNCIHINCNHMETCEGIMSIVLHYVMCEIKIRYESNRLTRV